MRIENLDPMILTLVLPLLGALLVGVAGRHMGRFGSALVASSAVGCSFLVVLSTIVKRLNGIEGADSVRLWNWMNFPGMAEASRISFGIYVDALSLTLMSVITGVGFLIHWYSSEYMENDDDVPRFFTLLNLFIAAMTFLVLADNYATLIIGWGGVGFASFALIGFWRQKPSAAAAARKAFVMNVIGDIGLMVAVFVLYRYAGTVDYASLFGSVLPRFSNDGNNDGPWLSAVAVGLIIAAYAKSAQLPLHTWLPDAMEGPTPVSALIHAATMVTAGVYLLVRSSMFLQMLPELATTVAYLGAATALFAACCAMVQTDLKRVLAYSTMSQLGYMFLAVGVGAYGPAIFHLVTHAFFKALLFLTAGIAIHAAHGEQDMRRLGGLGRQIPGTAIMFAVGGLALAGFPFTSGYFSKESILHAAHQAPGGTPLFLTGALVAVMTAFYTGRAFFLTFTGPSRIAHPHLPGAPTTASCMVLMVLALVSGFLYHNLQNFLNPAGRMGSFHIEPAEFSLTALGLGGLVFLALAAAFAMFGKGAPDHFGGESGGISFLRNGVGFDSAYGSVVRSVDLVGRLTSRAGDRFFQDSFPNAVGKSFHALGYAMSRELQNGQTRHYMAIMSFFMAVFLFFVIALRGGSQ